MQPNRIRHVVTPELAPRRPQGAGRFRTARITRWGAVALAVAAAFLALGWAGWLSCGFRGCPAVETLTSYAPDGAPVLLDRNGEQFAELKPAGHEVVELEELPAHVAEAFVAVEDRRFRQHDGVDWRRVAGALLANVRARDIEEGSSTITMQLARNVFPDRLPAARRTLGRKLLEVRVARKIEERFGKEEILELYLNYIYFGGGARGIAAASRLYFDKPPQDLSIAEAALLAALPKAPTYYDPRRHAERARERRDLVLDLMVEQERLAAEEAAAAKEDELGISRRSTPPRGEIAFAPYFVEQVREELEERFGDAVYTEPLRIVTTLDVTAQRAAEEELARQLRNIEHGVWGRFRGTPYDADDAAPTGSTAYLQGAVVVLAADTGDVLAWVGGRDFVHSRFDRVEDARRQVGSAFKPFVYATALAQGHPLSEALVDQPFELALDRRRVWRPKNFTGRFEGQVSLRDALVRSKNVPTVRLAQQVGTAAIARTARDLGLPGERVPRTPAMALGTATLSPLELTTAYTAFATLGNRVEPRMILEVSRPDGEILWSPEVESRRVLDPAVAFLLTDALADVVDRGTGTAVRRAGFRGPAAGKTGTTNDRHDTWFVGFTPRVVGGVWIGFDQPQTIVADAAGGRLAAPVWGRVMRRFLTQPGPGWQPPGDVVRRAIDPGTGLLLAEGCQPLGTAASQEYFLAGTEPQAICPSTVYPEGYVDQDWRARFQTWLDSWAEDGDELPELDEDPNDGIDIDRLPDGRVMIQNTGRGGETAPVPEEELDDRGLPPLERQPPAGPPVPGPTPEGTPPGPPEPAPEGDDGLDIEPLDPPDEEPELERLPPPEPDDDPAEQAAARGGQDEAGGDGADAAPPVGRPPGP